MPEPFGGVEITQQLFRRFLAIAMPYRAGLAKFQDGPALRRDRSFRNPAPFKIPRSRASMGPKGIW